jgi:HSP20 family molecular chaperone IbpA
MSEFDYPTLLSDSYVTYSSKQTYVIEMPLVGVLKEELNLKVEEGKLFIETKPSKTSKFVKNTNISFLLKEDVDTANISAKLESGLLTVTIPRTTPEKRSVNIKVN